MSVHAVLYSKPNCMKCRMTYNQLSKAMHVKVEKLFDPERQNTEWSNRKIEKFRAQGYNAMPVLRIYDDQTGERLDDWCDMQKDKIDFWKKAISGE